VRHAEQPISEHFWLADGSRLASENEKGSLKRIFGVLVMAGKPTAYTPDNRTVPAHQGGKSSLVPVPDEMIEQLPVIQASAVVAKHGCADRLNGLTQMAGRHVHHPLADVLPPLHNTARPWAFSLIYFSTASR
jgi:hypothetical protein